MLFRSRVATIDLPAQPQGESIAWSADGRSLFAGSEGSGSDVYRVSLPASVTGATATVSASPSGEPSATATDPAEVVGPSGPDSSDDSGALRRAQVWWLAAGAIVLIALGFSLRSWGKRDPADDES